MRMSANLQFGNEGRERERSTAQNSWFSLSFR